MNSTVELDRFIRRVQVRSRVTVDGASTGKAEV